MRIGIDIDNCISNFDDTLLKEYLKDKGYDEEYCNICITHSYQYIFLLTTYILIDTSAEE